MPSGYLLLKFFHVLIAILALGTSAGLGIVMELFGDDPRHGGYVLRAILKLEVGFVLPGFLLMPVTGIWMAAGVWPLSTPWIAAAVAIWGAGLALLLGSLLLLRLQLDAFERAGPASTACRRYSLAGRMLGAVAGLAIVAIVYLMVVKPPLTWLHG